MYLTTEPRIKQFFIDRNCGYLSGSGTLILSNFTLRNWSTEVSVPWIMRLFLSSTVISFPTRVLKKV